MAEFLYLGRCTRSSIAITAATIEDIRELVSTDRDFVRVEPYVPLDSVVRQESSLNVARHAQRALRGVARLCDEQADQFELWSFAQFVLGELEKAGWHFAAGESACGGILLIALTPASRLPSTMDVQTPAPGESRATEALRDYFGAHDALREVRAVRRRARKA